MIQRLLVPASSLLLLALAACGGDAATGAPASATARPSAAPTSAASAAATTTAAASASAAPAAPAGGIPADWAPVDLSSGGAPWKGHTIKAPPGATVKKAFEGPEVAKDKEFGLVVSFTDTKFSRTKSGYQDAVSYGTRVSYVEETADLLEYSFESTDAKNTDGKTYGFHMLVKVGTATYGCKTTVSKKTREELVPLKEACKSLTKA